MPKPLERVNLIKRLHEETGHISTKCTLAPLLTRYWWSGITEDVKSVVRPCTACDEVNGNFTAQQGERNPLPISGLFYRWSVDVYRPCETTARGYECVIVAVEYFSKYIILVPPTDKDVVQTSFTFKFHVLRR